MCVCARACTLLDFKKKKIQNLVTKLVVILYYNLPQYIFIGVEF